MVTTHEVLDPVLDPFPAPPAYHQWAAPTAVAAWRESALTRVNELDALARWLVAQPDHRGDPHLSDALFRHLSLARDAARQRPGVLSITGSLYEKAASNTDAAESNLLQIAPSWYVRGQMPSLLRHVERHLPASDRRLKQLHRIALSGRDGDDLTPVERGQLVAAYRAASSEETREHARVRSFRNVLAVTSLVLIALAISLAVAGFVSPKSIPLCFQPESEGRIVVVCPTEQSEYTLEAAPAAGLSSPDVDDILRDTASAADIFTVEAIGLLAAAVSAAAGLRNIRGTSTPFSLPVALAILKLPTGALTAFLGILLMRGGFVPGLSALDSSAQILAWAIVFGYAQQLFTRFVDRQANSVLDAVGAADKGGDPHADEGPPARRP